MPWITRADGARRRGSPVFGLQLERVVGDLVRLGASALRAPATSPVPRPAADVAHRQDADRALKLRDITRSLVFLDELADVIDARAGATSRQTA